MVSKERMTLARDRAIVSHGRCFDRSLAAFLSKGVEGLGDQFSGVEVWGFRDPSRSRARQVMGLGVLMKGSPLVGETS